MFDVGNVIVAMADLRAAGKPYRKPKYHVCVCRAPPIYFLINSQPHWADSFTLQHQDFPQLPNPKSYIACGVPLYINDMQFKRRQHRIVGALPQQVLLDLMDHVNAAEALNEQQKELIVDALTIATGF